MTNEIINYLILVSKNAEERLNNLMESYKETDEELSERSKEINQIGWVKLMNNYKNMAEKIVLKDIRKC